MIVSGNTETSTGRPAAGARPVIALIGNDDFSMFHFRAGIIAKAIALGYEPVTLVPDGPYVPRLREIGARVEIINIQRFISPLSDIRLTFDLARRLRSMRPVVVHNMTIKPNIFGTFAAKLAGVKRVVGLVAGAGYIFSRSESARDALMKTVARGLYTAAMMLIDRVWFQNKDDLQEFAERGVIARRKGIVIPGSGVNVDKFSPTAVPKESVDELRRELGVPPGNHCVVLIAARMIWSKGIAEFLAAARAHQDLSNWSFVLLAPQDAGTYDAVDPAAYYDAKLPNLFVVDTFRNDVWRFVALADISVLPSFYREGVPRSMIEAMAMGKPLVAADSIGTRDVIIDDQNGILVPPKDPAAFTEALGKLMDDDALRAQMGAKSREFALRYFDERVVVERVYSELYGLSAAH